MHDFLINVLVPTIQANQPGTYHVPYIAYVDGTSIAATGMVTVLFSDSSGVVNEKIIADAVLQMQLQFGITIGSSDNISLWNALASVTGQP